MTLHAYQVCLTKLLQKPVRCATKAFTTKKLPVPVNPFLKECCICSIQANLFRQQLHRQYFCFILFGGFLGASSEWFLPALVTTKRKLFGWIRLLKVLASKRSAVKSITRSVEMNCKTSGKHLVKVNYLFCLSYFLFAPQSPTVSPGVYLMFCLHESLARRWTESETPGWLRDIFQNALNALPWLHCYWCLNWSPLFAPQSAYQS